MGLPILFTKPDMESVMYVVEYDSKTFDETLKKYYFLSYHAKHGCSDQKQDTRLNVVALLLKHACTC